MFAPVCSESNPRYHNCLLHLLQLGLPEALLLPAQWQLPDHSQRPDR